MAQVMDQLVHARFDGRSEEVRLSTLHLTSDASDRQIKRAVAGHFDLPQGYLDDYVVVRTKQAIIVRPEAVYG